MKTAAYQEANRLPCEQKKGLNLSQNGVRLPKKLSIVDIVPLRVTRGAAHWMSICHAQVWHPRDCLPLVFFVNALLRTQVDDTIRTYSTLVQLNAMASNRLTNMLWGGVRGCRRHRCGPNVKFHLRRCEWQDKTTLASVGHLVYPLLLGGCCAFAICILPVARMAKDGANRTSNIIGARQHCDHICRCSHCVANAIHPSAGREGELEWSASCFQCPGHHRLNDVPSAAAWKCNKFSLSSNKTRNNNLVLVNFRMGHCAHKWRTSSSTVSTCLLGSPFLGSLPLQFLHGVLCSYQLLTCP